MSTFTTAHELLKEKIERKIADMDIKGTIDLHNLNERHYKLLVKGILKQYFLTGNFFFCTPKTVKEYVFMIQTCDVSRNIPVDQKTIIDLTAKAKKARDDLIFTTEFAKNSGKPKDFSRYLQVLKKKYHSILKDLNKLSFGER